MRLLKADESGDLDEVEQGQSIKDDTWTSGCLYEDLNDAMRLEYPDDENDDVGNVLLFLLSVTGGLHVSFNISSARTLEALYGEVQLTDNGLDFPTT